jgi:hypothetical protein
MRLGSKNKYLYYIIISITIIIWYEAAELAKLATNWNNHHPPKTADICTQKSNSTIRLSSNSSKISNNQLSITHIIVL